MCPWMPRQRGVTRFQRAHKSAKKKWIVALLPPYNRLWHTLQATSWQVECWQSEQEAQLLQRDRAMLHHSCHWVFRQFTQGYLRLFEITHLSRASVRPYWWYVCIWYRFWDIQRQIRAWVQSCLYWSSLRNRRHPPISLQVEQVVISHCNGAIR